MRAIIYDIKPLGWVACKLLRHVWRGCLVSPINGVSVQDLPTPPLPGDDWVRVRTLLGGICGTDLAILAQKQLPNSILQAFSSMPMGLGHENVAVVEQVGPAVDAAWVGKRVCVEPTLGCQARGIEPMCARCQAGEFGACENFGAAGRGKYNLPAGTSIGYNAATGGSLGETFMAHQSQLVALPTEIPDELAVLTDPLACSLHSALRADLSDARTVLVYGSGVLGLGAVACLRAIGFSGRIDVVGRYGYLDNLARQFGADEVLRLPHRKLQRFTAVAERTGADVQKVRLGNVMMTGGYDVIFDCVGSRQSTQECIKWTRARGQVVMVGTGDGGGADMTPIWFRELTVLGAYGRQVENFRGERIG
ncbi:MAG: hypothetical protein EHM48_04905, partial [Planctomycetaceae bacterium]